MRHLNPVLSAVLLSASLAPLCDGAVAAADYRGGSVTYGDGRLFTPMKDPLFYPADHPQTRKFCGEPSPGSTCGRLLKSNGGAHVPTIAPVLTSATGSTAPSRTGNRQRNSPDSAPKSFP